ncbi:hypothetical protein LSO9J_170005 [Candidatus Liberibacter solanacearum]
MNSNNEFAYPKPSLPLKQIDHIFFILHLLQQVEELIILSHNKLSY